MVQPPCARRLALTWCSEIALGWRTGAGTPKVWTREAKPASFVSVGTVFAWKVPTRSLLWDWFPGATVENSICWSKIDHRMPCSVENQYNRIGVENQYSRSNTTNNQQPRVENRLLETLGAVMIGGRHDPEQHECCDRQLFLRMRN